MLCFTVCDKHQDYGLLGCDAVQLVTLEPFQREMIPPKRLLL